MKIDIAKDDLQSLRDILKMSLEHMFSFPNISAFDDRPTIAIKTIRKINRALKKVHGHDCNGIYYEELIETLPRGGEEAL